MQKRVRRNKRKKQRNIIIVSVICLMFTLITAYSAFSTKLSITAKGNTIDKSRNIQSWTATSNEDFHSTFYKENIVTATFLDTAKVPENATKSWDVSVNKDRGVMAYVTESQTETGKYDLFIGAKNGVIANEDSSYLFRRFKNIKSIDFKNNFDTKNVINMTEMFDQCLNLNNLNISNFNTSNVVYMNGMFMGCSKIIKLDLSNFDTSNVTNMEAMFSGWNDYDSSNNKTALKELNLSSFDTSKVTNMHDMFVFNQNLTTLIGLENFNTNNVTLMDNMFGGCASLTKINLCSFDTNKVTNMNGMFSGTSSLEKVYVGPNWTTANADTTIMFGDSGVSNVTTGEC